MNDWSNTAWLVDVVLAVTLVEAALLIGWWRRSGRGVPPRDFLLNLVSGLWLMVALRAALGGASLPWIALCLMASGAAHAADLWRRWRR